MEGYAIVTKGKRAEARKGIRARKEKRATSFYYKLRDKLGDIAGAVRRGGLELAREIERKREHATLFASPVPTRV